MSRSRLGAVVIDCQSGDLDQAADFWGRALGHAVKRAETPPNEKYRDLETGPHELQILIQKVDHPSRVHLDIKTDDIQAEVQRLEGLGAKRLEQIKSWWVMEAPTGHRFCVVPWQDSDDD